MTRTLCTRTFKEPAAALPAGQRWVCHERRPLSGMPTDADGRLVTSFVWKAQAKERPAPPPPAPAKPKGRRGLVNTSQADLFPD